MVFFEAPHRLAESLADMLAAFGPRRALVAREMTKFHEEYLFGGLAGLLEEVTARPRKGELTLVVEGAPKARRGAGGFFGEPLEEAGGGPSAWPGEGAGEWPPEGSGEGPREAEPSASCGEPEEGAEGSRRASDRAVGGLGAGPRPPEALSEEHFPAGPAGSLEAAQGPLCSPRALAALKTLWEAARAESRPLPEAARELARLTGAPKKALYALLSGFRSPEE
jgi:hypothetical protein